MQYVIDHRNILCEREIMLTNILYSLVHISQVRWSSVIRRHRAASGFMEGLGCWVFRLCCQWASAFGFCSLMCDPSIIIVFLWCYNCSSHNSREYESAVVQPSRNHWLAFDESSALCCFHRFIKWWGGGGLKRDFYQMCGMILFSYYHQ